MQIYRQTFKKKRNMLFSKESAEKFALPIRVIVIQLMAKKPPSHVER